MTGLIVCPVLQRRDRYEGGKVTEPDVSSIIGLVEQFLLTEFSRREDCLPLGERQHA